MQFLHLFHEVYPPCDDYTKNRISYPHSVRIPDVEERIKFEKMLERDGFDCVVGENGYPVIYVNFTLKRFGNAVKAASSGCINRTLFEKDEFMKKVYTPYMTNASVRAILGNNYVQSAALSLSGSINTLVVNGKLHNASLIDFEKRSIDSDILQIRECKVTVFEPASDYRIEIKEGTDSSSYFYIRPIKVPEDKLERIEDGFVFSGDALSIEESYVECFLRYFVDKFFDSDLIYNRNRVEVLEDGYENVFQWYLTENFYTYETMEKMCRDMTDTADMLIHDFYNPALDEVKENFSLLYMTDYDNVDHERDVSPSVMKKHIFVVVDFYLKFVYRIRQMIDNNPDFDLISFEGP